MPVFASSTILPSLDDVRAHLDITTTAHDVELQAMLDAACGLAEQYVGPISAASVSETHFGAMTDRPIWLRQFPVLSVESVTSPTAPLSVSSYVLDTRAGALRVPVNMNYAWMGFGGAYFCDVTVSYTVGRLVLEPAIAEGILVVVGRLWETQRGASPSPLTSQPDQFPDLGGLPLLPPRARELWEPYRLARRVS